MGRTTVHRRRLAVAVQAVLVATAPATAGAAVLEFDPWVSAAIGYLNNIELNPDGEPQSSDFVGEAQAGFGALYRAQRGTGGISYRWRGLNYLEEDQYDSGYHNLDASGQLVAVPDLLYLQGNVFYGQVLVDPAAAPGFSNYFSSQNLQDAWGWSATPMLERDFGRMTLTASYTYGEWNYLNQPPSSPSEDSTNKTAYVSLGSSDTEQQVTVRTFYQSTRTEYESYLPYRYDKAGVDTGWALNRDWRLVAEYGLESDLTEDVIDGGLESPYWYGGFVYHPNERNRLELRVGERFFGNSYLFRLEHRARFVVLSASYSEDPTTYANTRAAPPSGAPPGGIPELPDFPGYTDSRTEPYLSRLWQGSIRLEGQRTQVVLSYYNDDQEFLRTGRNVSNKTSQVQVTRELSSSTSLQVWYSHRDYQEAPVIDTQDWVVAGRLSHEMARKLTLELEAAVQNTRRQDVDAAQGWWLGLRARKEF